MLEPRPLNTGTKALIAGTKTLNSGAKTFIAGTTSDFMDCFHAVMSL
jgi:X-X-X-Leu-X-X-Gly heptad repeat protein